MSVEIFYSPHADDEAIGMAGAIAHAREAGRRIVLVLITDNRPSARAVQLYSDQLRCRWHGFTKHALAHVDLGAARLLEFYDAAARLGADEIGSLGIPEQLALDDYSRYVDAVGFALQRYATMYPDAGHHVVAGARDVHAETGQGNPAHVGLAAAAVRIAEVRRRLQFHRIYEYSRPIAERRADLVLPLSDYEVAVKRLALDAYRLWDPAGGRVAFGYHSVPELIDAAAADPCEYVDLAA